MLYLALTPNQSYTIDRLNAGYPVPEFFMYDDEWEELKQIMTLQFENGRAYAAVLDAGYIPSGERTHDSLEDDIYFEETREGVQR